MDKRKLLLLVIDDSTADVHVLRALLDQARPDGFDLTHCISADAGQEALRSGDFDCVFLDYMLDDASGLDVLRAIRAVGNDIPVIAVSGCGNEQVAVDALKLGAQDYMVKGRLTPEAVERALSNAIEKVTLSRQLAEKQEELESFVQVAAHDLRGPLCTITTFADGLAESLRDSVDSSTNDLIRRIAANSRRMSTLVESLLKYTQCGRSGKKLVPVDLAQVMATVLDNLDTKLQEADTRVVTSEMPQVLGDEVALGQLLQNLVANAIKFRSRHAPVVRVTAIEHKGRWTISVADNGIGIAATHHEAIFAPFRRLHGRTEYEGSGIGLATCKRVAEQHGSTIWVESEPGEGATFSFTLPALDEGYECPVDENSWCESRQDADPASNRCHEERQCVTPHTP